MSLWWSRLVSDPAQSRVGLRFAREDGSTGQPHLALAILDHGSRACLRLQWLADKSSWTLLQELAQAVKRYGRPQYLRTDNEAVLVSRRFRLGLWICASSGLIPAVPGRMDAWSDSLGRSNGNCDRRC